MFEIIKFVLGLGIIAGVVYVIVLFYLIESNHKRRTKKIDDINNNVDVTKTPVKKVNDFYGMHKLENHEKDFFEDVQKKRAILDSGGQVGVNAAETLFLMRNNRHSDMVISEKGLLTIQKRIMDFQAPIADGETPRILTDKLPDYVARIEELPDGGYRKWFTDDHAAACGIKTLRFDSHGRSCGDPEMDGNDDKNKKKNHIQRGDNNDQNAAQALLADISKKMSRQNEMLADVLVDAKLTETKQQKFQGKNQRPKTDEIAGNEEIQIPNNMTEEIAGFTDELIDDIQKLEAILPPPDFLAIIENILMTINQTDDKEIDPADREEALLLSVENEKKLEDHSPEINFTYVDFATFIAIQASAIFFINSVIENVFKKSGKGNIFIDYDSSTVLIEKNYFSKVVRNLLSEGDQEMFDQDFFSKGATHIYDGVKISELLRSMNCKKDFISSGKNDSKIVFHHLLESTDVDELCFEGWFIKMSVDQNNSILEFISENQRGANVNIIASEVADIKKISKQFKTSKKFY